MEVSLPWVENPLAYFCFVIFHPRKRHLHRDNLVHPEPGIHFEHFHQAAAEQTRSDHENQSDRDLRRHDRAANALAALRTRLSPPAFHQALAQVTRCRACRGERSEAGGDRGGKKEREHKYWDAYRDAV